MTRRDRVTVDGFERDLTEAEYEALKERFRAAQATGKIIILPLTRRARVAAWARRWARFLRTPANGPLSHEHHDR